MSVTRSTAGGRGPSRPGESEATGVRGGVVKELGSTREERVASEEGLVEVWSPAD